MFLLPKTQRKVSRHFGTLPTIFWILLTCYWALSLAGWLVRPSRRFLLDADYCSQATITVVMSSSDVDIADNKPTILLMTAHFAALVNLLLASMPDQ